MEQSVLALLQLLLTIANAVWELHMIPVLEVNRQFCMLWKSSKIAKPVSHILLEYHAVSDTLRKAIYISIFIF